MIGRVDRELLAQAAIVVAVCIGGWLMFVQPRVKDMHDLEELIAHHQTGPGSLEQSAVESIASEAGALRERLERIELANELGRDSSRLYGMMMDLAGRHGVFVQSLNPGSQTRPAGPGVHAREVSISVQGEFEQVAAFLDAVNMMPGFIRPASLALVPLEDEAGRPVVVAHLGSDVLAFTMPEPLAAMRGGRHVER